MLFLNNFISEAMPRRVAELIIVISAAAIQSAHLFFIAGLNPNLSAAAILALAYFEKDILILWFLALASLIFMLPYPFGFWDGAAFLVAIAVSLLVGAFFGRRGVQSIPITALIFTPLFYSLLAPTFVLENLLLVFYESLLNSVWSLAFAVFFWYIFSYRTRSFVR